VPYLISVLISRSGCGSRHANLCETLYKFLAPIDSNNRSDDPYRKRASVTTLAGAWEPAPCMFALGGGGGLGPGGER